MAPVVHRLEEKYTGRLRFVYLDINDSNTYRFQDKFNVYYQPEFYLLDPEGKVLMKFIGYTAQEKFEEEIKKYIN